MNNNLMCKIKNLCINSMLTKSDKSDKYQWEEKKINKITETDNQQNKK